jgi:hypothetical protein
MPASHLGDQKLDCALGINLVALQYKKCCSAATDSEVQKSYGKGVIMSVISTNVAPTVAQKIDGEPLLQKGSGPEFTKMRERQSCKIRQISDALAASGFVTLDARAKLLGLCRSTTWTVLKGNHKGSGLSAATINRILLTLQLPSVVRAKVIEYVKEKAAGSYGHSKKQRSRFIARLSALNPRYSTYRSYRSAA